MKVGRELIFWLLIECTSSTLNDGVMLDITNRIEVSRSDNGNIVAKPAIVLLFNVLREARSHADYSQILLSKNSDLPLR